MWERTRIWRSLRRLLHLFLRFFFRLFPSLQSLIKEEQWCCQRRCFWTLLSRLMARWSCRRASSYLWISKLLVRGSYALLWTGLQTVFVRFCEQRQLLLYSERSVLGQPCLACILRSLRKRQREKASSLRCSFYRVQRYNLWIASQSRSEWMYVQREQQRVGPV